LDQHGEPFKGNFNKQFRTNDIKVVSYNFDILTAKGPGQTEVLITAISSDGSRVESNALIVKVF
jgi:hypothetical protein